MSAMLEIADLSFSYPGGFTALRDVSVKINRGEFVCVIGPSGCGKSTLLDLIDGLAFPTAGRLRIDGEPVGGPGPDRSMVFQSPGLLPWRTVAGNIAFALESTKNPELRSESRYQRKARIDRLINLVGLAGFSEFLPGALSGGMRQRVNLARALAVNPSILLMDEPFANLDALTRDLMQIELLRIWQETSATVVFITHNIQEAVFLADRVIAIGGRPGRVKKEVEIDLPRPRDASVKSDPKFVQYQEQIWGEIAHERPAAT